MSLKYLYNIRNTHSRGIASIGFNPTRREIILGFEDGTLKVWEAEPSKFVQTLSPSHQGWVTAIMFWPEIKTVVSAGQDGVIMFWSGNSLVDIVHTEEPIYSMNINIRKSQLVCGSSHGIVLYELDKFKIKKHYIDSHDATRHTEHTDIVKCLKYFENRVFSAGFDQKVIIYESGYHGVRPMTPIIVIKRAHDAGINNLIVAPDSEGNNWLVTSAFDKVVKIWTTEGKLVHRLDEFGDFITGICATPKTHTIWIAAGYPHAIIFEPKSGENVSSFSGTFLSSDKAEKDGEEDDEESSNLQMLISCMDHGLIFGSNTRRQLLVWKFVPSACITTFNTGAPVDCLAFTQKIPVLIFSTDMNGEIVKWERRHTNQFAFSKESLKVTESMGKLLKKKLAHRKMMQLKKSSHELNKEASLNSAEKRILTGGKNYAKIQYMERYDTLIAASEDSNVYIIGYDEKAFQVLQHMVPDSKCDDQVQRENSENSDQPMDDQVTKRVAGFKCNHVLIEHQSIVTSFVVVPSNKHHEEIYLITSGWDRRICIWNLLTGDLLDIYRNANASVWEEREFAAEDAILDLAYCESRKELAIASADNLVYIRRFSYVGKEMSLLGILKGHQAEVCCIRWWPFKQGWITGSEDHSIRLWESGSYGRHIMYVNVGGPVTCLEIDTVSHAILVAVGKSLKVYEPSEFDLVQQNDGHTDAVRSVIHIPDNKHFNPTAEDELDISEVYITASWDGRISVWHAWRGHAGELDQNKGYSSALGRSYPPRKPLEFELSVTDKEWEEKIESKVRLLKQNYVDCDIIHGHDFEHFLHTAKHPTTS